MTVLAWTLLFLAPQSARRKSQVQWPGKEVFDCAKQICASGLRPFLLVLIPWLASNETPSQSTAKWAGVADRRFKLSA